MFSPCQKIGNTGENWAYDQLTKRGYDVQVVGDYFAPCVDMRIGLLPIEVKFSRISYRRKILKTGEIKYYQRWQWNVTELDAKDRVLFLIAQDAKGFIHPFIMPGSVMSERYNFQISRHPTEYKGLIAGFLNRWETVEFMHKQLYKDDRQLDIYHYLLDGEAVNG